MEIDARHVVSFRAGIAARNAVNPFWNKKLLRSVTKNVAFHRRRPLNVSDGLFNRWVKHFLSASGFVCSGSWRAGIAQEFEGDPGADPSSVLCGDPRRSQARFPLRGACREALELMRPHKHSTQIGCSIFSLKPLIKPRMKRQPAEDLVFAPSPMRTSKTRWFLNGPP